MPPLPVQRNPMVLMGSYLANLSQAMIRLAQFMQRTGDLLQRENILTNEGHRRKTNEMAVMIGEALEELSKASGSVAHLYKKMAIGPNPGQCRLKINEYDPLFESIVRDTNVIMSDNQDQAASSQEEEKKSGPAAAEESKTPQAAAASKSEEDARIMARMASQFNQLEMLTIVMGNFQQINHFKARVQKVLKAELPGDGKNKEDRKRLVDRAFTTLKEAFSLPDECRDSIYEEFDPVLITTECIEKSMYKMFDDILDYEGDDAGFIKMFKANNAELIVKIISEIEEGFIEGFKDVIVFLRISCVNLLMATAPP